MGLLVTFDSPNHIVSKNVCHTSRSIDYSEALSARKLRGKEMP